VNESANGVIEGRKILLRDSQGRVRVELAAESLRLSDPSDVSEFATTDDQGPEVAMFGTNGRRRISIRVLDHPHDRESHVRQIVFYGDEERPVASLDAFGTNAGLSFHAKDGTTCLRAGFRQFDDEARPEIVLAGPRGWRAMLLVAEDRPHVTLYDGDNAPRLHLTVDQQGAPRIRRYWWRSLIPHWRWLGYYPRDGANR
jgi:hypothetical protein